MAENLRNNAIIQRIAKEDPNKGIKLMGFLNKWKIK